MVEYKHSNKFKRLDKQTIESYFDKIENAEIKCRFRKRHICDIKFYKNTDGTHVFWFYHKKIIYKRIDGQYLYIKANKVKLKKHSILSIGYKFWELESRAENFRLTTKRKESEIRYDIDHVTGFDDTVTTVSLKVENDKLVWVKIKNKRYEYQKINSNAFSVELPSVAKEAFNGYDKNVVFK
jgi:hypothetical protein